MGSKPKAHKSSKSKRDAAKASQKKMLTIAAAAAIFVGILLIVGLVMKPDAETAVNSGSNSDSANTTGAVLPEKGELPAKGMLAPDFHLTILDGEETSLSDYRGKVVAVNLWATWCPPCRAELPGMNAVYDAYHEDGFVLLAVNGREEESLVSKFINEEGFTFPVLLDPQGQVMSIYSVYSFPTTYIIDRDGVIRYVQTGPISAQDFEKIIVPLL